jgi:hypothetical protein
MTDVTRSDNMTAPAGALSSAESSGLFLCLQTVAERKQKGNESEEMVLGCKTWVEQLTVWLPGQAGSHRIVEAQTLEGCSVLWHQGMHFLYLGFV